jgi:hypothetical protein
MRFLPQLLRSQSHDGMSHVSRGQIFSNQLGLGGLSNCCGTFMCTAGEHHLVQFGDGRRLGAPFYYGIMCNRLSHICSPIHDVMVTEVTYL